MAFLSFSQLLSNIQAKAQQLAPGLVDFGIGRPWNALANVIAEASTYLTGLIATATANARLLTADDPSVDTFVADFVPAGFPPRQTAVPASGLVTFAQAVAPNPVLIPAGATVKTVDGSQSYAVQIVATHPLWNAGLNGYLLPVGTLSTQIEVQALVAGSAGNVGAGTISLDGTGLTLNGASISNPVGFTNGQDGETSAAVRTRFWAWLQTRALGTEAAVASAIASVQQGLTWNIVEASGIFYVYLDNGSGAPPTSLLQTVSSAINAVRPITIRYVLAGPNVVQAAVSLQVYAATGYSHASLIAPVQQAVAAWINALGVGVPLRYYDVATVARSVPGVAYIEGLTVNGAGLDIGGGPADSVHPIVVAVS